MVGFFKATVFVLLSSGTLLGFFLLRRILSSNLPVSHPPIAERMIRDKFFTKLKIRIPMSGDRIAVGDCNVLRDVFCHKAYTSLMIGAAKIVSRVVPGGKGGRTLKRLANPVSSMIPNTRRPATVITRNIAEKTELAEETLPNLLLTIRPHRKPAVTHKPIRAGYFSGSPKRMKIMASNTWIDAPKTGPNHAVRRLKLIGNRVKLRLKTSKEHVTKAKIFLIPVPLH